MIDLDLEVKVTDDFEIMAIFGNPFWKLHELEPPFSARMCWTLVGMKSQHQFESIPKGFLWVIDLVIFPKKICCHSLAQAAFHTSHWMMPICSLDIYAGLIEIQLSLNKGKGKIWHFKKYAFYPKMKLFYNVSLDRDIITKIHTHTVLEVLH